MRRGRPFRIEWRAEDTAEALQAAYRAERRVDQRQWLLRTGRSLKEVAAVLGVHYRTVQRWVVVEMAGQVAILVLGFAVWHNRVPDGAFDVTGALIAAGVLVTVLGVREPDPIT